LVLQVAMAEKLVTTLWRSVLVSNFLVQSKAHALALTVGDTPLMFTTAGLRSWVVAETELFLDKFGVNGQRAVGPLGMLEDSNLGGDQNVRIKVHGGIMEVGALRDGK
jgi:hypothetical protein